MERTRSKQASYSNVMVLIFVILLVIFGLTLLGKGQAQAKSFFKLFGVVNEDGKKEPSAPIDTKAADNPAQTYEQPFQDFLAPFQACASSKSTNCVCGTVNAGAFPKDHMIVLRNENGEVAVEYINGKSIKYAQRAKGVLCTALYQNPTAASELNIGYAETYSEIIIEKDGNPNMQSNNIYQLVKLKENSICILQKQIRVPKTMDAIITEVKEKYGNCA